MTDLIWYGPPYSLSGYATHNREIVLRLPERGFNVKLIPTEDPGALEPQIQDKLIALTKTELEDIDNTISISCIPQPPITARCIDAPERVEVNFCSKVSISSFLPAK